MNEISLTASFIGGVLSFFSPCILPLLPVYVSLFSGLSIAEINQTQKNSSVIELPKKSKKSKLHILEYTLIFIAGFSVVYLALGAGSSIIGTIFFEYQNYLRSIGGIFLVLFGLLLIGLIKSGFFMREFRLNIKLQRLGTPVGAFLIGIGFAAGWSPCIGPILGSILIYSSMSGNVFEGLKMLGMYSLGIAIPFLIASLLIDSVMRYLRRFMKFFQLINYIIGFCLIISGLLMISGTSIV